MLRSNAVDWLEANGYEVASKQGRGGSGWASFQTLQTDKGAFFVKTARRPAAAMFEGEALGLEALRAAGGVCVPKVLHYDDDGNGGSYLIMDKLNMGGRPNMKEFGRALALMHMAEPAHPEAKAGKFGFEVDNTIGGTPQRNTWTEDWVTFVREHRLGPQVQMAGSTELKKTWDKVLKETGDLKALFSDIDVKPSILHGDLWSGNYEGTPEGVAIFDPATYYGHHEAEFGMSWCAGFTRDFWSAYREVIPEAPLFSKRREAKACSLNSRQKRWIKTRPKTSIREPNQQGFQRSRAMGGETHFFHPSTDTKQEIAVMCESTCPVVMADAHL